ncbi:DUF2306 domain-containing protein [Gorillibacterium massiliense]|uniref:DUF2306 domain-containing protein n=1 Tax=Gorillibacterium massiliense TaxID=1280390 RepID=UPI0004ADDC4C|nr:DUF2306 domain-containing protein [Gorillibacterium massiliense]
MGNSLRKYIFILLGAAAAVYVLAIVYTNLFAHPGAAEFLSHKTELGRSLHVPVWLTMMHVHVIAACLATLSGALNFSGTVLQKWWKFHRVNGYLYVLSVLVVDLTSGYMATYSTGGRINTIAFNCMNTFWLAATVAAIVQIKRKRVEGHRKWMIRSYVFCFTNLFIHGITYVLNEGFSVAYETSYTVGVYGAIALNFIAAEIAIRLGFANHPISE